MKNIKQYIFEKFKLNSNNIKHYSCQPQSRDELQKIISKRITKHKLDLKHKEDVLDFNDIDTSKVNSFNHLFVNMNPLKIDISEWDTSNVKKMNGMFDGCEYLQSTGNLGNWNIKQVDNTRFMFNNCRNLKDIGNLSSWKVDGIEMDCMFQNCVKLKDIGDISHWKPKEANWAIFPKCDLKIMPRKRI